MVVCVLLGQSSGQAKIRYLAVVVLANENVPVMHIYTVDVDTMAYMYVICRKWTYYWKTFTYKNNVIIIIE